MSLEKTTAIAEKTALVFRIDAFDLLNHVNFGNPNPDRHRRCHQHLRSNLLHSHRRR
jgi:hypothetical protein